MNESSFGFTLLEMLIVISIISMIGSVSGMVTVSSYSHSFARSDQDLVRGLLREARTAAMNGVSNHGLHIEAGTLTLLTGAGLKANDKSSDTSYPLLGTMTIQSDHDIVFAAVSGTSISGGTIILTDHTGNRTKISVSNSGTINDSSL